MESLLLPLLLFAACSLLLGVALLAVGSLLGPRRTGRVKAMPYEAGMDPIHDARKRFDVRFLLVAVAFLVFDVELLFLYPWAVANKHRDGLPALSSTAPEISQTLIFVEVMVFLALLAAGFAYTWRKGVFQWR